MSSSSTQAPSVDWKAIRSEIKETVDLRDIVEASGVQGKREGKRLTVLCPFHADKRPSLSILHDTYGCFACGAHGDVFDWFVQYGKKSGGEALREAAQMAGVSLPGSTRERSLVSNPGLSLAAYAKAKGLPVKFLQSLGLSDEMLRGRAAVRIPYRGLDGAETAIRYRLALKEADDKSRFRWKSGPTLSMYGLWRVSHQMSSYLALVEGESDCHTLWFQAVPALGLPGAATWDEDRDAPVFRGFDRVFVVDEGDEGSDALRRSLSNSSIRPLIRMVSLKPHKDPSALFLDDPEHFHGRWEQAIARAVPWPSPVIVTEDLHSAPVQSTTTPQSYTSDFVHSNEPSNILRPTLSDVALYGVAGDFVRATEPHSEADNAVLLTNFLVGSGNLIGSNAHAVAQQVPHAMNLFAEVVGDTGKGRKGSSMGPLKTVMRV